MITYRTTTHPATADEAFAAMQRHHARQLPASLGAPVRPPPPPPGSSWDDGDLIYGARAIAQFLFGQSDNKTRRRVFCLAQHYRARKEKVGFVKLKGALCLSKSQWCRFHGFG